MIQEAEGALKLTAAEHGRWILRTQRSSGEILLLPDDVGDLLRLLLRLVERHGEDLDEWESDD